VLHVWERFFFELRGVIFSHLIQRFSFEVETAHLLGRMGVIAFRFEALPEEGASARPAGDIVFGDKKEIHLTQITNNSAREAAQSLNQQEREALAKAFEAAGLLKPQPQRITQAR